MLVLLGSTVAAVPWLVTYVETGLEPRLPTAVLADRHHADRDAGLRLRHRAARRDMGRREAKRLRHLAIPGVLNRAPGERT